MPQISPPTNPGQETPNVSEPTTSTSTPAPMSDDSQSSAVAADEAAAKEILQKEMIARNSLALEAQVEERPLAKLQEELQEAANGQLANETPASHNASGESENTSKPSEATGEKHHRKALLKNDDAELRRVKLVSYIFPCDMLSSGKPSSSWMVYINGSSKPTTTDLQMKANFQAKLNLHHLSFTTFE
jgi:hypothetical protein